MLFLYCKVKCRYAEWGIVVLSVFIVTLSAVILGVIMLGVVAMIILAPWVQLKNKLVRQQSNIIITNKHSGPML